MNLKFLPLPLMMSVCLIDGTHAQDGPKDISQAPQAETIPESDVPKVTTWREDDTEGKVRARTKAALLAGVDQLEALGDRLLNEEMRDGDGRYTMPYFYSSIQRGDLGNGKYLSLNQRFELVEEWHKKFPNSYMPYAAKASLLNYVAMRELNNVVKYPSSEKRLEVISGYYREALDSLEKAKALQDKDAGWHVTRLIALGGLGDRDKFNAGVDDLLATFPECGYALSRAASKIWKESTHNLRTWETWLRTKLAKLPPEVAAKSYANTIIELLITDGSDRLVWGVMLDLDLLNRGMDEMAKAYPVSAGVACSEVYVSTRITNDRIRIRDALKRANGTIDQMVTSQSEYTAAIWVMTHVFPDPRAYGLPAMKEYRLDLPDELIQRIEKAAADGPAALEALAQLLSTENPHHESGRTPTCVFYDWFGASIYELSDLRDFVRKEKILFRWRKEFPDSKFAHLAEAKYWSKFAWNSRGRAFASQTSDNQWKGFEVGLAKAKEALEASAELKDKEPTWSVVSMSYLLGTKSGGMKEAAYAEVAPDMLSRFPETMECLSELILAEAPKWGGTVGAWQAYLIKQLENKPEDVRAKSYAIAVSRALVPVVDSKSEMTKTFGDGILNKELCIKGMDLLVKENPDDVFIANTEALLFSQMLWNPNRAMNAMKRANGVVHLLVWQSSLDYEKACRKIAINLQKQKK